MKTFLLTFVLVVTLLAPAVKCAADEKPTDKRLATLMESMRDHDPLIRRAAATGIGEIGDKSAVPLLADVLAGDADVGVRLNALGALELIGGPDAIAAFEKALGDPDERVREGAAYALSGYWGQSAHKALVAALKNEKSAKVRRSVAEALGNPGVMGRYSAHKWDEAPITQSALQDALANDPDYGVRAMAARQLGRFKNGSALDALLNALAKDKSISVRSAAAEALGKLDMPGAVKPLIDVLYFEKDEMLLMSVLKALRYYTDPKMHDALISVLDTSDSPKLRWQAIDVLEESRDTGAVDELSKIADDDYEPSGVRAKAEEALQSMGVR
jgi:HEAT repeat protein